MSHLKEGKLISPVNDFYMTVTEVAEYLKYSRRNIQEFVYRDADPLPAIKLAEHGRLRVLKSDLDAWIQRNNCKI